MNITQDESGNLISNAQCKVKDYSDASDNEIKRFWSKIEIKGPTECWEQRTGLNPQRYGQFWFRGKNIRSHIFSYGIKSGPFLSSLCVCHHCDNPACCNPAHLFLGTNKDNTHDMIRKNRHPHGSTHPSAINPGYMPKGENHHWARKPWLINKLIGRSRKNDDVAMGERHGMHKLTAKDVIEIRENAHLPRDYLAKKYGIGKSNVGMIIRGVTWKHI